MYEFDPSYRKVQIFSSPGRESVQSFLLARQLFLLAMASRDAHLLVPDAVVLDSGSKL